MKYSNADSFQADYCAERLKALGEPLRLRIVDLLRSGEFAVTDIAEFLETEVVTVSHHLQILKNSKIVSPRREGRYIYYCLHSELFQNCNGSNRYLDLGCCRIEMSE